MSILMLFHYLEFSVCVYVCYIHKNWRPGQIYLIADFDKTMSIFSQLNTMVSVGESLYL